MKTNLRYQQACFSGALIGVIMMLAMPSDAYAAATRTGTASEVDGSAGSGSTSVTVPADADAVVAFWSHWDGNGGSTLSALTLNGSGFTIVAQQAEGAFVDNNGVGVAVLANPATGSQTFAWTWSAGGARSEGGEIVLVYVKGVDVDDLVRDSDLASDTDAFDVSVTVTSETTDLVLGFAESWETNPSISGTVFINNSFLNTNYYDVSEVTAGSPNTTITMTNESFSSMAGISLKEGVTPPPSSSATTLSRPPNNLGLVGYWSLDDGAGAVATDFSGRGNHGALVDGTWVSGKRGKALGVDGTDDHVDLGTPSNLGLSGNQAFTISAWINPTATRNEGTYFSYGTAGSGRVISLSSDGSGNIYSVHSSNDHSYSRAFELDRWQHVVITYDGATERLYYDGASTGLSWTPTALNLTAGDQMYIGRASWSGVYAHSAAIDEVRLYNRALSESEVASLARAGAARIGASSVDLSRGSSLERGLVGHWTLDGTDTLSTITDRSGQGNHGYFYGGATSSAKSIGVLGQALTLDGISHYVRTPVAAYGSAYSVAYWVKGPAADCEAAYSEPGGALSVLAMCSALSGAVNMFIRNAEGTTLMDTTGTLAAFDSSWHHIVWTDDSGAGALYIDGVSDPTSFSYTPSGSFTMTYSLIGAWLGQGSDTYSSGYFDDVRIYDRVLTAAEAKRLFDLGQVRIRQ